MKKILMAAVAVSALTAGSAFAAQLSSASTVGGQALTLGSGTYDPFTIANEVDAPGQLVAALSITPSATGIANGVYNVAWNISGGTFSGTVTTIVAKVVNIASTPVAATCTLSSVTASTISAQCTTDGTAAVGKFTLDAGIVTGVLKAPVFISGTIATTAGTAVDGGTIASVQVVDYRAGYKAIATARSGSVLLSTFTKLRDATATGSTASVVAGAGLNNFQIGSAVGLVNNDNPLGSAVVADLVNQATATVLASGNVTAISATVGGNLSVLKPVFGSAYTAGTTADFGFTDGQSPLAGAATATLSANNLAGFLAGTAVVGVAQAGATAASISESTYSISMVPTLAVGYTAGAYATKNLGSLTYEGATIIAPWIGDGANGINTTIRLNNTGATALPFVQVKLVSPFTTGTSGTVASTASCTVGTVPASGELLISSATLQACFGNFKRADVTILVGSVAASSVTAKARTTSVNGTVSEVTLGKGTGGALSF